MANGGVSRLIPRRDPGAHAPARRIQPPTTTGFTPRTTLSLISGQGCGKRSRRRAPSPVLHGPARASGRRSSCQVPARTAASSRLPLTPTTAWGSEAASGRSPVFRLTTQAATWSANGAATSAGSDVVGAAADSACQAATLRMVKGNWRKMARNSGRKWPWRFRWQAGRQVGGGHASDGSVGSCVAWEVHAKVRASVPLGRQLLFMLDPGRRGVLGDTHRGGFFQLVSSRGHLVLTIRIGNGRRR